MDSVVGVRYCSPACSADETRRVGVRLLEGCIAVQSVQLRAGRLTVGFLQEDSEGWSIGEGARKKNC